jgi:hypothetical protein
VRQREEVSFANTSRISATTRSTPISLEPLEDERHPSLRKGLGGLLLSSSLYSAFVVLSCKLSQKDVLPVAVAA